mmetsp:Transcript_9381/g.20450  ORF Transcript_9381/g.20450 Transcript_9381/m.20450 type:complete len:105 (+) Transcript_9381:350-664(+)
MLHPPNVQTGIESAPHPLPQHRFADSSDTRHKRMPCRAHSTSASTNFAAAGSANDVNGVSGSPQLLDAHTERQLLPSSEQHRTAAVAATSVRKAHVGATTSPPL